MLYVSHITMRNSVVLPANGYIRIDRHRILDVYYDRSKIRDGAVDHRVAILKLAPVTRSA